MVPATAGSDTRGSYDRLIEREALEPLKLYEFRAQGNSADRPIDVVLLHGLTGHPLGTWCDWPSELSQELSTHATFWSLGYPAPIFDRELGIIREAFEEEARAALRELVEIGFGNKPLVFVTHSLGGLLAKAILVEASKAKRNSQERSILDRTHAVIFAGTPHAGSHQSNWRLLVPGLVSITAKGLGALTALLLAAAAIPVVTVSVLGFSWSATLGGLVSALVVVLVSWLLKSLTVPGRHIVMLDPNNPGLAVLTREFRRVQSERSFAVDAFYEQKRLRGLFMVVPRWSADPGIRDCDPQSIPADHFQICKPPYSNALKRAIRKRVTEALRGRDMPVFLNDLKRVLPAEREQLGILFGRTPGDRSLAEEKVRTELSKKMANREFTPTQLELDVARGSDFDEDALVWNLWHEQVLAAHLRELRTRANDYVDRDFASVGATSGQTLSPFYRELRTIEHVLGGDLTDPGWNATDRDLLRQTVEKASSRLRELADTDTWDGDGRTRPMLLRLESLERLSRIPQEYFGKGKYRDTGKELSTAIERSSETFKGALGTFRRGLGLPEDRPQRLR